MDLNRSVEVELFNVTELMNYLAFMPTPTKPIENVSVTNTSVKKFTINPIEWRFMLPPYFVIFILSMIGNILVIIILLNNRRMRTVTNIYLLNLAISDILLGVFCMPFTLIGQIYRRFLFGDLMCRLIPFMQAVTVSVDVWTLVAISVERYFAICRPLKSRRWQTKCHAYKTISTVWILSLFLNSPILYVSTLQHMNNDAFKCREVWPNLELERAFNIGLDATLLLIPFLMMSLAYSLIVKKLWRRLKHEIQQNFIWQRAGNAPFTYFPSASRQTSCKSCRLLIQTTSDMQCSSTDSPGKIENKSFRKKNKTITRIDTDTSSIQSECFHTGTEPDFRHAVRSTNIDKSIKAKRKVIMMLFVIILEFFICWTPLHVINTIYLFYPGEVYETIGAKGIMSLQLLAYCSSCCNPITYSFMNKKFKVAFINSLRNCGLFRECSPSPESDSQKQATPLPSSQDLTACIVRGSRTGRTDCEPLDAEEWDSQRFSQRVSRRVRRPGENGFRHSRRNFTCDSHTDCEALDGEEQDSQRFSRRASRRARRPGENGCNHNRRNFTCDGHTDDRDGSRRQPVPVSYHIDAEGRVTTATATL